MGNRKKAGEQPAQTADEAPPADGQAAEQGGGEAGANIGGQWDNDGEQSTALDRMARMVDELDLSVREQLVSDVQMFILDTIKARPKPWSGTSQQEQRDVIAACRHASAELVRKVVEAVAAGGTQSIRILLTKVSLGNDIVITGKVKAFEPEEEDQAVATLHHALNKHVMLTAASADDYKQGGGEPVAEPDQPEFGYEGDDDDLAASQDDEEDEGEGEDEFAEATEAQVAG